MFLSDLQDLINKSVVFLNIKNACILHFKNASRVLYAAL